MGWWQTNDGIIGDPPANLVDALPDCPATPADIPPETRTAIEACYRAQFGRLPTIGELRDLLAFCQ